MLLRCFLTKKFPKQDTKDNGEEDEDDDDDEVWKKIKGNGFVLQSCGNYSHELLSQDGSDEEGSGEASSDVEVDLVQRLKNLSTPNDPDTLTRLPVRVSPASHDNADRPDGSPPTSEAEVVPSEVMWKWHIRKICPLVLRCVEFEVRFSFSACLQPMLAWGDTAPDKSEKGKASTAISNPSSSETKGKGGDKKGKEAKAKGDDAKKDGRAAEEGKQGKKDGAHSTAKTEEKKASVDPELDAEAGVDAETLAAHHMPDLIEGHQPMFSPPPSSASAAASTSTPISASKPKHNGTLGSEGSLQASAAAAAGSAAPAPPAPAASGDEEVPAQTAAAPAQAAAKDDTSSGPYLTCQPCHPWVMPSNLCSNVEFVLTYWCGYVGNAAEKTAPEPSDETVYYDCFDLKIVYERNRSESWLKLRAVIWFMRKIENPGFRLSDMLSDGRYHEHLGWCCFVNRTGFEETKDFPIEINGVIAGRYQVH
jgi:hypothetical protein